MTGRPRRQPVRISALAGWLFADLFLVLFLVALAAAPSVSHAASAKPARPPKSTVPRHPSRPKSVAPTVPGMANQPVDICVSQGSSSIVADFDKQVKRAGKAGHKVGFILVFATGASPGPAVTQASRVLKLIKTSDSDKTAFATAGGEGLWGGTSNACRVNGGTNNYHFQVFFYL